ARRLPIGPRAHRAHRRCLCRHRAPAQPHHLWSGGRHRDPHSPIPPLHCLDRQVQRPCRPLLPARERAVGSR
ncbi:hypothetical protein EV182_008940, partial [Spiromyces aspiralis]